MIKSLEQTLVQSVNNAKVATQEKLFKQFVKAKDKEEREVIGSKMNVLDALTFEFIKEVRKSIT